MVNQSVGRVEELSKMFPGANIKVVLMPKLMKSVRVSDAVFTSTGDLGWT